MFSNGNWCKNVKTVGEVIAELSLLDPDLPVCMGFDDSVGADLVVFNRDKPDKHLEFCDGKEWDNEFGTDRED